MNTLKRLLPEGAFDLQSSPEKKIGPYISNLPSEYGSSSDDSTGTVSIPPKEYLSEPISELSVSTEPTTSDISSNQILSIKPDEVTLSSEEVSDVPEQKSEQSNKPLSSMIAETFFPPSAPHPTPIPSTTSSSDIDWSEFENSNQNDSSDSSDSSDSEGSWLAPVATAATMSSMGSTGSSSENTSDFFHNLLNDKVHSHYTKKGHSKGSRVKKSIRLSYKRKHSPKRSYKNASKRKSSGKRKSSSKRKSSGKRKSASKRKSSKRSYKRYTKRSYKK